MSYLKTLNGQYNKNIAMKIIKVGSIKPKETKKTCGCCKTKFSFTSEDIKPDIRDGNYVHCPVCGAFINV